MAWRIQHLVEEGEFDNTVKGRVIGWIKLEGRAEPIQLRLRGNCHRDLAGWKFRIVRFESEPNWDNDQTTDLAGFRTQQDGHVGDLTADMCVRHFECSVEEFLNRKQAGEPVPDRFRPCIYLEWYSERNGRVVIQSVRLAASRIGTRAFELTDADRKALHDENEQAVEDLRQQGFVIEEAGPFTAIRRKEDAADTPLWSLMPEEEDSDDMSS